LYVIFFEKNVFKLYPLYEIKVEKDSNAFFFHNSLLGPSHQTQEHKVKSIDENDQGQIKFGIKKGPISVSII
jgi:hypothetical protein